MDIREIIDIIIGGGLGGMTLLQFAPIKINPWSFVAKKLGRAINGEVITRVDELSGDISALKRDFDERGANDCRTRILRFNDEILHNIRHTKEHFDQILIDVSNYESYCENHKDYKNNIAGLAIERIKKVYADCMEKGTFL